VTRCAIYLRTARDDAGDGQAIARQREDCLRFAAEHGWDVVAEYADSGVSAWSGPRPGYDRMVEAADAGEFGALVCRDLSRLTRNSRQLAEWAGRGVVLATADDALHGQSEI
jgi:site-specific DNA recombinase